MDDRNAGVNKLMPVPLNTVFRAGGALGPQLDPEWLRTVAYALNELNILGGVINKTTWTIIPGGNSSASDAITYSFQCLGIGTSSVSIATGWCQYAANDAVQITAQSFAVSSNARIYISLDINTGAWTGPTLGPDVDQDDDENTEHYMIANITVVGGVISAIHQRILGDIYESKV